MTKILDESEIILNDEPAKDIFSEFDELDEIEVTNEKENTISNFQDLIDEAKAKKENKKDLDKTLILNSNGLFEQVDNSISDELDLEEEVYEMNMTKEITNLKDEVLDKLDELQNEEIEETSEKEEISDEELAKKADDDNAFRTAFIYTAIVGFVILFICYGIYLYLLAR